MSGSLAMYGRPGRPSPVVTLLWEEWRLTRMPLIVATVLGVLGAGSVATLYRVYVHPLVVGRSVEIGSNSGPDSTWISAVVGGLLTIVTVVLLAGLLLAHFDRSDIQVRFPRRLFTLPLRTRTLVLTRMVYGWSATSLVLTAVTFTTFGLLRLQGGETVNLRDFDLFVIPVAVAILAYLQAICWSLGRFGFGWGVVGTLVLAIPVAFVANKTVEATLLVGGSRYCPDYSWFPCRVRGHSVSRRCHRPSRRRVVRWHSASIRASAHGGGGRSQ